jgi:hypothetical protein
VHQPYPASGFVIFFGPLRLFGTLFFFSLQHHDATRFARSTITQPQLPGG